MLGWRVPGWSAAPGLLVLLAALTWGWREIRHVARMEQERGALSFEGQSAAALPGQLDDAMLMIHSKTFAEDQQRAAESPHGGSCREVLGAHEISNRPGNDARAPLWRPVAQQSVSQ